MSRTVPSAMQTHLSGSAYNLALCYKITRTDNVVFGFTTYDSNLKVQGDVYLASSALLASALQTNSSAAVDNLEVVGALDSVVIKEDEIRAGKWDNAKYEMFTVNWKDPDNTKVVLSTGEFGNITRGLLEFKTELISLSAKLSNSIGRISIATCDATLGDSRCKVNLASFTTTGVAVTSVTNQRQFTASSLTQAANYFAFGKLTWTSGQNTGIVQEIDTYSGAGALRTKLTAPYTIQVGDQFTIVAGCPKTVYACINTFSNVVNFRGRPYIPGADKILQVGRPSS